MARLKPITCNHRVANGSHQSRAYLATHDLRFGYLLTDVGPAILLVGVLLLGRGQPSVTPRAATEDGPVAKLPATDARYRLAMLIAGTLGTASGDWVADSIGLGVGSSVLVAVFILVLVAAWQLGKMPVLWHWGSIVAARTAGTTLDDYLASRHGPGLGIADQRVPTACMLAAAVHAFAAPAEADPRHRPLTPAYSARTS